jgi:iron complex transport system permease protein
MRRSRLVPVVGVLALLLALAGLCIGQPLLSPLQLTRIGDAQAPHWLSMLVLRIRLPRLIAACVVGAALGLSGHLLQTLARNRLAGPDLMGLNDGALFTLALSLLLSPDGFVGPWWCALIGALLTAGFVLIAAGGVGPQGYRVIVVGLGVASLLRAGFDIALSTLPIMHAGGLYAFSVGSLAGRGWPLVLGAALALLLCLVALVPLQRGLALMGLQDDSARSLGLRLPQLRLVVLLLAAALAGVAVSVAGPLSFVAIVAPILARRADASAPPWFAAIVGMMLVLAADLLGRVAVAPAELPAGVVTGLLGGPFLLWLLLRSQPLAAGLR